MTQWERIGSSSRPPTALTGDQWLSPVLVAWKDSDAPAASRHANQVGQRNQAKTSHYASRGILATWVHSGDRARRRAR
jgi:hypothetical protein